jgi:hypothetical protein
VKNKVAFSRTRVAIDIPASEHEGGGSAEPVLHVGHARTVLLGDRIARELGTPFDIRLDGLRVPGRSHDAGVLVSLCTIISRLNIQCRRVYWIPQKNAASCEYDWEFGSQGEVIREHIGAVVGDSANPLIALAEDDFLYNHPSLIVRGSEFADLSLPDTGTTGFYVTIQREAHLASKREMHEVNVPLITRERRKLSKSLGTSLTWEFFSRFPGQWVQDWLIATALSPTDPQSALGIPFSLEQMTTRAYEWSWEKWDRYVETKK